jgi:hypothetical protein
LKNSVEKNHGGVNRWRRWGSPCRLVKPAALYVTSDADWEVAVLVYLQGYRLHDDLELRVQPVNISC